MLDAEEGTFAKSDNGFCVFFEKLKYALFLSFSHVRRSRIGIKVVRTDLEWNQAQGLKGCGLDHRHVLGGFEARASYDGSCAGTYVERASVNRGSNGLDQMVLLEFMKQPERIAATDENDLGLRDGARGVGKIMNRGEFKSHMAKASLRRCDVGLAIVQRVRDEGKTDPATDKIPDAGFDVIEISETMHGGVADQ